MSVVVEENGVHEPEEERGHPRIDMMSAGTRKAVEQSWQYLCQPMEAKSVNGSAESNGA